MNNNKIYLARHWQNQDNANWILNWHRDLPLTDIWINQANELAKKIKDAKLSFDKIYSSPLIRAFKTAEIISDVLEMEKPEPLNLIIERDFGIMSGKSQNDIEKLCAPNIIKTDTITYFLNPEWAETFPQLMNRAKKVLEYIENKHSNQSILLAMHWDIGKMIYAEYYNLDWKNVLTMFHFWNSELLLLSKDSNPEDTHIFNIDQFNH